jgi:hypothetical protein
MRVENSDFPARPSGRKPPKPTSGKLDFYFLVLFGAFWCFFVKK